MVHAHASSRRCSRRSSARRSTIPTGCSRSSGTASGSRRSSTAGSVRLWTRGEKDAARYFGPFLDPPTWLARRQAVVDGEVIALDERGEPDFALLQARIKGRGVAAEPTPFVYEVFDLLHLDGRSLLDEPLEERRRLLAGVLRPDPRVRLSEHIEADGIAFFEAARAAGPRGDHGQGPPLDLRARQAVDRWQKIKIRPEQELVVGGWVKGTGKAVDLGALLVGVYEDGGLRYAGKIGAGFTNANRAELLAAVAPLAADDAAVRDAAAARRRPRRPVAAPGARHPRRVRRLDRRRPRPPGGLQGHRAREGPAQGHPRAPEELTASAGGVDDVLMCGVELGATVALAAEDMQGVGRTGYLLDPDHNVFGIWLSCPTAPSGWAAAARASTGAAIARQRKRPVAVRHGLSCLSRFGQEFGYIAR